NKSAEFMKPIDKSEFAANLMIKALKEGAGSSQEVLNELMDRMNIHGISVFQGEDMHCEYSMGHYAKVVEQATYALSEKYQKTYDEHGIRVINNMASLSIDFPEVYECFKEHNICSSLEIFIRRKDDVPVLISFDIFGEHRRKWSAEDVNTIYMVVKAITNAE
ncbi:MAG: hypothetical protein IJB96_11920, partial [Lachnospira sp.]|nr:hypothetical protein [Lachnospira sp.]